MQLSKINKGLLCMINCHQNKKNGQKGHKTILKFSNSQKSVPNSTLPLEIQIWYWLNSQLNCWASTRAQTSLLSAS